MPCRLEEQGESGSDKARCRPCSAKLEKAVRQVNFANLQSQALWVLSARAQALFVAYLETISKNASDLDLSCQRRRCRWDSGDSGTVRLSRRYRTISPLCECHNARHEVLRVQIFRIRAVLAQRIC